MRYFYTLLFSLLLPFALLKLAYRGIKAPAYWKGWLERLGFFPHVLKRKVVWVHAVSVGEVQAATPFIKAIKEQLVEYSVVVTTTTPTGRAQLSKTFGDSVNIGYLPYDLPWAVALFLKRIRPSVAVIMETELWPNLFYQCHQKQIPLMIANARLSPRSIRGYKRIQAFVVQVLADVDCIAAQSEDDAQRFIAIGAVPDRVMVTKNIKFDLLPQQQNEALVQAFRSALGAGKKVWIAASTHEGEDELVLQAYAQVIKSQPETVLLLVPRHPERFNAVASLAQRSGFNITRRSESKLGNPNTQVFIGDSMGEMMFFYQVSDVAFVGGSLVPTGGHNILEPASVAVPSIVGPHTFNFKEITEVMLEAGAVDQVSSAEELLEKVSSLLLDERQAQQMGSYGYAVVEQNRGATTLLLSRLKELMASQ